MEIKSQQFLKSLDTDKNDNGITIKELKTLDKNKDGIISDSEVNGKISNKDLKEINTRISTHEKLIKMDFPFVSENTVLYSNSELNPELFPGGVEGISHADVIQGTVGDCWFLSALASLAERRPKDIVDMIKDNKNGTFTVKFPGLSSEVTVSKPTEKELEKYAHRGSNNGIWAAVLEKAYAEHLNNKCGQVDDILKSVLKYSSMTGSVAFELIKDKNITKHNVPQNTITPNIASQGISIVTGSSTDTDILTLTRDSTIRSKLTKAFENDKVVTLHAIRWTAGSKENNIPDNHIYSVLSFDPKTDTVRVRNPWGPGSDATGIKNPDNLNDGVFTLTIAELNKYFSDICYEE